MKVTVELFTSPTCPFCPVAKKTASEVVQSLASKGEEVELTEFSTATKQGMAKANEYGIAHVPELVVYGDSQEKILIEGSPSAQSLERAVRMAQGKEEIPRKKTVLEKARQFLGV